MRLRGSFIALVAILAIALPAFSDTSTTRHLLAGVRAFKEQRYEEALVELRIVQKAPDAPDDLAYYLGPTLYKLERYREALGVFVTSTAATDPLTDFYLGQTYYQLKLYRKSRAVFAALRAKGLGPALDEAAARYVDAVDAVFATAPGHDTIDYYVDEGTALTSSDPVVASELLDEARLVEGLASTRYRHAEICAALGVALNAAKRPALLIAAIGGDRARGDEATWQLARAYATVGDAGHAKDLLGPIAAGTGAHAQEAAKLLSP